MLLCQPVCRPECRLPFEASDMLLASLVLGVMLIVHDMDSAAHEMLINRARRHLLEFRGCRSLHQAWHTG